MSAIREVTQEEAAIAARESFEDGVSVLFHGDSGVGKSEIIVSVADQMFASEYGYEYKHNGEVVDPKDGRVLELNERPWLIDFRTALHDSVDLTGVPFVNEEKETEFAIAKLLPRDERGGVFFSDEINRGTPAVQNATFSLNLTKTLGTYRMPKTWHCAAAINDNDIGANKMAGALNRRFTHFRVVPDLESVIKYANKHNWNPYVIAFLRMFPNRLNEYDPKVEVSPNPRGWSFVSRFVTRGGNPKIMLAKIAGTVGNAAAIEFDGYLKLAKDLPSIESILNDPAKSKVPAKSNVGALYAISAALAARTTPENFDKVIIYLERLPDEFNIFAMKDTLQRNPSLVNTKEFTEWIPRHQDVVL